MPALMDHQTPALILQPMPSPEIIRPVYGIEQPFKVHRDGFTDDTRGELFINLFVDRVETIVLPDHHRKNKKSQLSHCSSPPDLP